MAITADYSQRSVQDIEAPCLSPLPNELTLFIMSFFRRKSFVIVSQLIDDFLY